MKAEIGSRIRIIKKQDEYSLDYQVGDTFTVEGTWYGGVHEMCIRDRRQVDCQVYFDMESGQATSISFAPRYTTGERMERAALNTVIGMGTVFIVLIFISLLIYCFRFINIFENKMKKSEKPAEEASAPAAVPVEEPAEDLTDDRELVAVITAAIAASEGVPADGLVVRSIKRAPASKWKRV